jgi:hypothetical protein
MATREEYERRLLGAVESGDRHSDGETQLSQWYPRLACERLASELAAILAERDAPTVPPPQEAGPAAEPLLANLFSAQRYGHHPNSTFQMLPDWNGSYLDRNSSFAAARLDAIAHAESVAGPLRARIAALESQLAEATRRAEGNVGAAHSLSRLRESWSAREATGVAHRRDCICVHCESIRYLLQPEPQVGKDGG